MKKLIAMLLVLMIGVSLVACGNDTLSNNGFVGKPSTDETPDNTETVLTLTGTMEESINAINENHAEMELPLMVMPLDLTDVEGFTYYTGLTSTDNIVDAAFCEPMMGQPYSLVLVRVAEGADAEAVAKEMYEKVDMRKWVCMEADTKTAAAYGDVAMFFMVNSEFAEQVTTTTMMDAFKAVCGEGVTVIG